MWKVQSGLSAQSENGAPLFYMLLGSNGFALNQSIEISRLHRAPSVLCLDITDDALNMQSEINAYNAKMANKRKFILIEGLEQLDRNKLNRLNQLFKLKDKTTRVSSLVVTLHWNTDNRELPGNDPTSLSAPRWSDTRKALANHWSNPDLHINGDALMGRFEGGLFESQAETEFTNSAGLVQHSTPREVCSAVYDGTTHKDKENPVFGLLPNVCNVFPCSAQWAKFDEFTMRVIVAALFLLYCVVAAVCPCPQVGTGSRTAFSTSNNTEHEDWRTKTADQEVNNHNNHNNHNKNAFENCIVDTSVTAVNVNVIEPEIVATKGRGRGQGRAAASKRRSRRSLSARRTRYGQ